jgi:exonuclease III
MDSQLRIVTYNSTGLGDAKLEYVRDMLDSLKGNILLLQETWLLPNNLEKLNNIHKDFLSYGVSAIDNSVVLQGRPYGGLAILWHHSLGPCVKRVKTRNCRLCCIYLEFEQNNVLIMNVYMPVDSMSKTHVNMDYMDVCDEMELLLADLDCNTKVILAGDLNTDFSRGNAHDLYLKDFIDRHSLLLCWQIDLAENDNTYWNEYYNSESQIDHFIFSHELEQSVSRIFVLDCPLNLSGHRPVVSDLHLTHRQLDADESDEPRNEYVLWHKVKERHKTLYRSCLDRIIEDLPCVEVLQCKDLSCHNPVHQ